MWQTLSMAMHVLPQGLPFLQLGPAEAGAAAALQTSILAILPLASWQLPLASMVWAEAVLASASAAARSRPMGSTSAMPRTDSPRTPAAIVADARTTALSVVAHADDNVRGCFTEWAERHPGEAVTLTVALTVGPDGHAHSPNIDGSDDSSLPLCTGDALTRLAFPALDAVVKLRLTLSFKSGALALASSVTSTENVTGIIDLAP